MQAKGDSRLLHSIFICETFHANQRRNLASKRTQKTTRDSMHGHWKNQTSLSQEMKSLVPK